MTSFDDLDAAVASVKTDYAEVFGALRRAENDLINASTELSTARDQLRDCQTATMTLQSQLGLANETITALRAKLEEYEPVGYRFWVGADNNEGFGNNTLSAFKDADRLLGPLRVRRSFPSLSAWPTAVGADKAAGYTSYVSAQVPNGDYAGVAAGRFDAQIKAAATPLPAGTYVTMNHEPENDVPGPTFVAMFRRFYTAVKAANPSVLVGPTHLTYAWRNGVVGASGNNTGTQQPRDWDVGDAYRDFTAADTYNAKGGALKDDPQFRAWFDFFDSVSNKPLAIAEYGQCVVPPGQQPDPAKQALRAQLIAQDAEWLKAQPKFTGVWLVWNGSGAQGNWKLLDQGSQDAWKAVAAKGRTA